MGAASHNRLRPCPEDTVSIQPDQSSQKPPHGLGNGVRMGFEGEMPGIQKLHLGFRQVTLISLGTRRQKERIMLAPDNQASRLICSKILLERRIKLNVGQIITKQVKLYVSDAFTSEKVNV